MNQFRLRLTQVAALAFGGGAPAFVPSLDFSDPRNSQNIPPILIVIGDQLPVSDDWRAHYRALMDMP